MWLEEIFLAALWRVTNYVTASRLALTTIWTRCNSEKLPKECMYPSVHVTFVKKFHKPISHMRHSANADLSFFGKIPTIFFKAILSENLITAGKST